MKHERDGGKVRTSPQCRRRYQRQVAIITKGPVAKAARAPSTPNPQPQTNNNTAKALVVALSNEKTASRAKRLRAAS